MGTEASRVEKLTIVNFRNISQLSLEPGPHFNVVHGENGAGKSSLLEAVLLLRHAQKFSRRKKRRSRQAR